MAVRTLLMTSAGGHAKRFVVSKSEMTLGRSVLNDVVIPDSSVSRAHARLIFDDEGARLEDLGSANGTTLNGARVTSSRVTPADRIRMGSHTLQFLVETAPAPDIDAEGTQVWTLAELEKAMAANPLESYVNDISAPRLAVMTSQKIWEVTLQPDVTVIGRSDQCEVPISSSKVSRKHAQIEQVGNGFRLRDLGSSNGTWLAGRRIEGEMLHDGDTFSIGDARCVFKAGLASEQLTIVDQRAPRAKRRPVVVVPGIMGSNLFLGETQVWPNVRLMLTNPDIFKYPGHAKLEARGLVSEVVVVPNFVKQDQYNRLTEFLSEGLLYESGKDLLEFAYDWRQDVRLSARELGAAIERWGVTEPITIIAHSLGTLVSRYYVDCLGGSKRVDRIAFLGAPHYGVPKSVVVLHDGPSILPFGLMNERGRSVLSTFPSAHQILPTYPSIKDQKGNPVDVLNDDRWLPAAQKAQHAAARELRQELPARSGVSAVCIFGYGLKTVTRVTLARGDDGCCRDLDFVSEEAGDTGVPEVASVLAGTEIHPVRQHHGSLYTDKDVQMRLRLELSR